MTNRTLGALFGYSSENSSSRLNVPPSHIVSSGLFTHAPHRTRGEVDIYTILVSRSGKEGVHTQRDSYDRTARVARMWCCSRPPRAPPVSRAASLQGDKTPHTLHYLTDKLHPRYRERTRSPRPAQPTCHAASERRTMRAARGSCAADHRHEAEHDCSYYYEHEQGVLHMFAREKAADAATADQLGI